MATTERVDRETGESTEGEREWVAARLNPRFIQMRQGRPFIAYPGLLDLLHQLAEGYFSVETDVVQLPTAENGQTAVVQARVRIFDPQDADVVRRLTTGIGDADPSNVSAQMRPHLLRMAETRAKARALRDAVNVGMAALEELGPDEQPERVAQPGGVSTGSVQNTPRPNAVPPTEHIVVGDRTYSRDEVTAAYLRRVAQAREARLALGDDGTLDLAASPLSVIVAMSQQLKRRLDAMAAAAPAPGT